MVQKCTFNRQPCRRKDFFHTLLPLNIYIFYFILNPSLVFCKTVTQKTRKLQNDENFSFDLFLFLQPAETGIYIMGTLREMIIMHSFRGRLEKDIHNLTIKRALAITI